MKKVGILAAAVVALFAAGGTTEAAFIEMYEGSVSYTSDAEGDKTVMLPSFDTMGGLRTLLSVQVDIWSDASVEIAGDNDDFFKEADVAARMIRNYRMDGPGVVALSLSTINGGVVHLLSQSDDPGLDGGSVANFDPTAPDGTSFGTLSYSNLAAIGSPFLPAVGLYATPTPSTVSFTVLGAGTPGSALLMVNDQQFFGTAPDAWQLEVQNPILTVHAKVTYEYVPEPATMSMLSLGALALIRRRRRA